MPYDNWYKKYQWIEVDVERSQNDPRPESFRPSEDSIKPIGDPISSTDNWNARREIVFGQGAQTMCALHALGQEIKSLGVVRPAQVVDLTIEPADREWKSKWTQNLDQLKLFEAKRRRLEKIPYKFSYHFTCEEPGCKGHKMMIEDWEIGQLYLTERERLGGEELAAQSVRRKFFEQMCAPDRDPYFYVGTILNWGTWVILGVFWPKRS